MPSPEQPKRRKGNGLTTPEVLQAGLGHQRAGRLDEAAGLYQLILAAHPHHPDALHYLGVTAYQRGDYALAINLIRRAIRSQPKSAPYHSNLAEAHQALGQLDEAEACCRKALDLHPQYPEALLNLSVVLFKRRRFEEAEAACRSALSARPDFSPAVLTLADTLREQGRTSEALETYQHGLDLAPDQWAGHANYGLLLTQRGEMDQGLRHCRRAVELAPAVVLAHENLGRLLLEYGSIDEAMEVLSEALKREPNSPRVCLAIGAAWVEVADGPEAQRWFARASKLAPELTEARCRMGDVRLMAGDPDGAAQMYRAVLEKEPERIEALAGLARARLDLGDVEGSVASYRESLRLRPEAAALHAALGFTLSTAGDLAGAVACLRTAIDHNPDCVAAHGGLLTTLRGQATGAEMRQAEELLTRFWMTEERRATLYFGLAQACDGHGDWTRAAHHMVRANAHQKAHWEARGQGYEAAEHSALIDRLRNVFSPAWFDRVRGLGVSSERPVFIVGMPRSGTTLAEQILATHPRVFGAGERLFAFQSLHRLPQVLGRQTDPFACMPDVDGPALASVAEWHLSRLRQLDAGEAERVVDKMPGNYQLLGFLASVFPKARFIHCRRDMRDVALSCWITQFAHLRWAFDLEHIAHRIWEYQRMMDHWRRVLPVPLLDVDYEELIEDQEGVSRRLVAWLGLEWDEQCLNFHQTERLVRTASVAQVRQPIYRRSMARWKRYEDMLSPVLARLGRPAQDGDHSEKAERRMDDYDDA